jgi:D-alanyl-D-alanine carboxypeptidase/D-alanyl-D-alanine-endopeptidase (penicillin-binding protein 4)
VAVVQDVGSGRSVLSLARRRAAVNPASLAKLLTTYAALDLLGPAWTWSHAGVAAGPGARRRARRQRCTSRAAATRSWCWSACGCCCAACSSWACARSAATSCSTAAPSRARRPDPGDFDGEPLRPYNVRPDALLLNYKLGDLTFVPDAAAGVAQVQAEPPLAGVTVDATVPLVAGPCGDWRGHAQGRLCRPGALRFAGSYPAGLRREGLAGGRRRARQLQRAPGRGACGARWAGKLGGSVRDGLAAPPAGAPAGCSSWCRRRCSEVVRDINKFSNNVMAQQLFLTLGADAAPRRPARRSMDAAREVMRRWWPRTPRRRSAGGVVIDNGSGLSRETRASSAQQLARLLQWPTSPVMPELMSSLPVTGLDGTLRRAPRHAGPRAPEDRLAARRHRRGRLRAGDSGRRYVLVAIVNHPNGAAARPALDALVQWTMRDAPSR